MDRLESLIDRVSGKGEVRIAQYHAGEILEYEETKGLERLAQKREEYFIRNGKSIEEQMEEYWQRILLEEREIRGELRVYAGLTSMMVTAGMAGCILGAGFAAAPVAAKVFEGAVKGLAFTSIVYNTSEIYEGIGDIVLAGKGDIVSVAANPVRDLLPEEMQWVYYCIGEGSGLILQAWGMTSGFMMLSQVYGVKTAAVEFVKIETSGLLAGQMGEAAEKNGASAADVYRLEMAAAFVSYGMLSGMRPAVRAFKNESDLWMNRLTVPEIPVVYQSYWEGRRIAGQRKEELLGIEKIDEYRGQGGREQGAGTANEGGTATLDDWVNRIPELSKQAPIEIPSSATVKVQVKNGYDQISFKWIQNGQNYEVRWHTKTPGAPEGQGNTWVVSRVTPGTPMGQVRTEHILVGDTWIPRYQWQDAINAYRNGIATQEQLQLLKDGHWQAP